ncbi:MAG: Lrp/AsnC family transcriptional regulator [Candidatus Hodarchaeota archaeon]
MNQKKNDELSLKILEILKKEPRMLHRNIAEELGISRSTVSRRVQALIDKRIIRGYRTIIALRPRIVLVELKTNPQEQFLLKEVLSWSEVTHIDGVIGNYSLILRVQLLGEEDFPKFLKKLDSLMSRTSFKKYRVVEIHQTYKEDDFRFPKPNFLKSTIRLSETDQKILSLLSLPSPKPWTSQNIAESLNKTQPAIFKRLKSLKERGLILGEALNINYGKLGINTIFNLQIKIEPDKYDEFARALEKKKEVVDLYRTGLEYGLLARIRTSSISEYNDFLKELFKSTDLLDTHSTLVLEEISPLSGQYW